MNIKQSISLSFLKQSTFCQYTSHFIILLVKMLLINHYLKYKMMKNTTSISHLISLNKNFYKPSAFLLLKNTDQILNPGSNLFLLITKNNLSILMKPKPLIILNMKLLPNLQNLEVGTGFNNSGLLYEFCDILEFIKI